MPNVSNPYPDNRVTDNASDDKEMSPLIPKTRASSRLPTVENNKSTGPTSSCFHSFSRVRNPDETLSLPVLYTKRCFSLIDKLTSTFKASSFSSSIWAPINTRFFPSAHMQGSWGERQKGSGSPTWQRAVQLRTSYSVIFPLLFTATICYITGENEYHGTKDRSIAVEGEQGFFGIEPFFLRCFGFNYRANQGVVYLNWLQQHMVTWRVRYFWIL